MEEWLKPLPRAAPPSLILHSRRYGLPLVLFTILHFHVCVCVLHWEPLILLHSIVLNMHLLRCREAAVSNASLYKPRANGWDSYCCASHIFLIINPARTVKAYSNAFPLPCKCTFPCYLQVFGKKRFLFYRKASSFLYFHIFLFFSYHFSRYQSCGKQKKTKKNNF